MGEAVRRAHEIYEEEKKGYIQAVEVIDRKTAADDAVYRVDRRWALRESP